VAWVTTRGGGTSTADSKAALRRRIVENRSALDASDLALNARRLRDVLLAIPEIDATRHVAAYVSVGREPGTGPLIEALFARGVEILLPMLLPDGDLDWARYTGAHRLVTASRGLLEPTAEPLGVSAVASVDVVLVPGLAVDRRGTRLGRGGGSYDRALARVGGRAFTCAVLHDGEFLDIPLPRDPHDVSVAAAATPSGLHRLR
jgi:5-formyltetrahydrofolate cyclo-ligase